MNQRKAQALAKLAERNRLRDLAQQQQQVTLPMDTTFFNGISSQEHSQSQEQSLPRSASSPPNYPPEFDLDREIMFEREIEEDQGVS